MICACGCGCEPDGDWHFNEPRCCCVALGCDCVRDAAGKPAPGPGEVPPHRADPARASGISRGSPELHVDAEN